MIKKFDAFSLARQHYQFCKSLKLPSFLRDQMLRASSSIALNIAEGSGRPTFPDKRRFFTIALGSLRECQAIVDLESINNPTIIDLEDKLGAVLYVLSHPNPNSRPTQKLETKLASDTDTESDSDSDSDSVSDSDTDSETVTETAPMPT